MEGGIYYLLLLLAIGLIFAALGIPLKQGRIPPNHFYGFRTPRTLRDEAVWYPVNRVLGVDMIRVGVVIAVVSLVMMAMRGYVAAEVAVLVVVATMILAVVYMAIHGFTELRKY
jgi:uncharacterized membrane protein